MPIRRAALLSVVVTALSAVATFLFSQSGWSWSGWDPATCLSTNCFCEAVRPGPIVQPVNTYSNLAFVFVGCLILGAGPRSADRGRSTIRWAALYGSVVILIGLGSLFYHASLSFIGQWLDVMGMYLLITFAFLHGLDRLHPIGSVRFTSSYLLLNLVLGILLVFVPQFRREIFAGLVVLTILVELGAFRAGSLHADFRYFVGALAVFASGYGIWVMDNSLILCSPASMIQGHAVWHMTSAIAAGLLFLFLSSTSSDLAPASPKP